MIRPDHSASAPDSLHGEGSGGALWGIVDGARDDSLFAEVRRLGQDAVCLFAGKLDPSLAAVSPYLVRLREGAPFLARWRGEGLGQAWGILFRSDSDMETLRRFFRQHLDAEMPDGRRVLFRFYDPRVFVQGGLAATEITSTQLVSRWLLDAESTMGTRVS